MHRFNIAVAALTALLCLSLSARSNADWQSDGEYTLLAQSSFTDVSGLASAYFDLGQPFCAASSQGVGGNAYVQAAYRTTLTWDQPGDAPEDAYYHIHGDIGGSVTDSRTGGHGWSRCDPASLFATCPENFSLSNDVNQQTSNPYHNSVLNLTFQISSHSYDQDCYTGAQMTISGMPHG